MGKNEAVKKKYCLRHATPNFEIKPTNKAFGVSSLFFSA